MASSDPQTTLRTVTYDTATHKIVPIEATFNMLQQLAAPQHDANGVYVTEDLKEAYRAMLNAAPDFISLDKTGDNP